MLTQYYIYFFIFYRYLRVDDTFVPRRRTQAVIFLNLAFVLSNFMQDSLF